MAIIKCKMCGGDIELSADKTFGTCEYCGSAMTFPKVDDEHRATIFNRGNHFRRIGEFDKALAVYEQIVRENENDAEAHWCCALCRFGIEYVEDPASFEWLPTCHRASFDSFLEDVDYLAALEHSDGITRRQYQKDAARIAEVQRGILATSQNAEPYDVFICYKETDENGQRTKDSLLAQDIYYQLTEQGRKVFFARITLEDVVGKQYEPYIFAALNSAKVMVVVGTKPEYLNAVWVKNEWSRFLAMMKKDRHKLLLPCYRDMDPYDMPEQLGVLQSYDMSKIGFIQDLIRGISKVLGTDKKSEPARETVVVQQAANNNVAALLKRVELFLEDKDWQSADEYCEKVLDIDPENALAYVGKLMVQLHVARRADLQNCAQPFADSNHYQKALRFADAALNAELRGYIDAIRERIRNEKLEKAYTAHLETLQRAKTEQDFAAVADAFAELGNYKQAAEYAKTCQEKSAQIRLDRLEAKYTECTAKMRNAVTESAFIQLAAALEEISDYKDSADLALSCRQRAEDVRVNSIYNNALAWAKKDTIRDYEQAITLLKQIPQIPDYLELTQQYQGRIAAIKEQKLREQQERDRKRELARKAAARSARRKKIFAVILVLLAILGVAAYFFVINVVIPRQQYQQALDLMQSGQHGEAATIFIQLGDYKDAKQQIAACYCAQADTLCSAGNYDDAIRLLAAHDEYPEVAEKMKSVKYAQALAHWEAGNYDDAIFLLSSLGNYSDAATKLLEVRYAQASAYYTAGNYLGAVNVFSKLTTYKDGADRYAEAAYACACDYLDAGNLTEAEIYLTKMRGNSKFAAQMDEGFFRIIDAYCSQGAYSQALAVYALTSEYSTSTDRYQYLRYQVALDYLENKDYIKACDSLKLIEGYLDSDELLKAALSGLYTQCIENQNYTTLTTYIQTHGAVPLDMSQETLFNHLMDYMFADNSLGTAFINKYQVVKPTLTAYCSDFADAKACTKLYNLMKDRTTYASIVQAFGQDMATMTALWDYEIYRNVLLSDLNITAFMLGRWESSSGKYLAFTLKDSSGTINMQYTLPADQPSGAKYYDVRNQNLVWLNSSENVISTCFEFTFVDANTVKVYCLKDAKTYTLTRSGSGGTGSGDGNGSVEPYVRPVEGKAYKLYIDQKTLGQTLYINGKISTYYLDATQNKSEGVDVYVERAGNGYYLYYKKDGKKIYINIVKNGIYINAVYENTASSVWRYDADLGTLVTTLNGVDYVLGVTAGKEHNSLSPRNASNPEESYIARFCE